MSDERRQRSTDPANDASVPPDGVERNETLIRPDGHLDAETLSAWLDSPDDFTDADRRAIEAHLVDCTDCSLVLGDLAAIVGALQAVALVEPPRSFALTAAQAGIERTGVNSPLMSR